MRKDGLAAEIDRVDTQAAFEEALRRGGYGLIVADYSIPGMDALEALRLARKVRPEVPFIFLSGAIGEETAIEMLKLGASDYVLKQRIERLVPAVRRALQEVEDRERRNQAEKELARLAAIVEFSDDAILSKDLNGIIQTWNAGAERIFGYRAEEVIGQPITLLVPPERIQEEQILERLRSGKPAEQLETVRVTKDGRRIDVLVSLSPIKDREGQIIGASKIVRDITERKRASEMLRLSEEKFAKAFASNPAALMITRLEDGLVLEVNETWQMMFGYSRDEAIGRTSTSLRLWPTPEDRARSIEELRETGSVRGSEHTLLRKSGEPFSTLLSAELLSITGEEVILSAWLDIQRPQAERGDPA